MWIYLSGVLVVAIVFFVITWFSDDRITLRDLAVGCLFSLFSWGAVMILLFTGIWAALHIGDDVVLFRRKK